MNLLKEELTENLSEEELTEIWNAILDNEVKVNLWIYLFDLKSSKEYLLVWGTYKGRKLYFEKRSDWGVILSSIRLEREEK